MKKYAGIAAGIIALFITCVGLESCTKDAYAKGKSKSKTPVEVSSENDELDLSVEQDDTVYEDYQFIEPEKFFNLDYRPEKPEKESTPVKVDLNNFPASEEESTNAIPGLRKLDEYQIQYQKKRMSLSEYLEYRKKTKREVKRNDTVLKEGESLSKKIVSSFFRIGQNQDGDVFYVKSWSPQDSIPAELSRPQFTVEFNQPLKALEALKDQDEINKEGKNIFTITPEIEGKYTFLGTKSISFLSSEVLNPNVEYTITVNENLVSSKGIQISGERTFKTKTAPVRIVDVHLGLKKDEYNKKYFYGNVPAIEAKNFRLILSGFLTEAYIKENFKVTQKNKNLDFKVYGDFDVSKPNVKLAENNSKTNSFHIEITSAIAQGESIQLSFMDNAKESVTKKVFDIAKAFEITRVKDVTGNGNGTAVRFEFNQSVDEDSVYDAVTINGEKAKKSQIYTYDSVVTVRYISVKPQEKANVEISNSIQSKYGENPVSGASYEIVGRDYAGYVNYITWGHKILEAQFPHKILFEYMNVTEDSAYKLTKLNSPYDDYSSFSRSDSGAIKLSTYKKNVRNFEEIDLEPYLVNGRGTVLFQPDISYYYYDWDGDLSTSRSSSVSKIQVTDLAATIRFGINKAVVMVRTMSDNKSVTDAEVWLSGIPFRDRVYSLNTKYCKTDKDGMAVIDFGPAERKYFEQNNYYPAANLVVNVKTKTDKVSFIPDSHSSWGNGVYSDSIGGAYKPSQRTFLFCDRGLYKPGETITFRGIDRNRQMGSYIAYKGGYTVKLKQESWRSSKVYSSLTGNTTESGGFYGSFKIPEDVEPGEYEITYYRNGTNDRYGKSLYFTVAYFEPLKIQSELKMNSSAAYAGDTLRGSVAASYLAGGYLAGAEYSANWYCSPYYFTSSKREYRNYRFSKYSESYDDYDYRRLVSTEEGYLDSEGKADFSCAAEGDLRGVPYLYKLEVGVTDVSNQKISASQYKIVNPASFYIGVGCPLESSGFIKKSQTVNFPVVLLTPDENLLSDTKLISGSIKYSLTREYWTTNYRNSVNDSVYESWEKHIDEEASGSVSASAKSKIKITPKNAGWYTLTVTAKDSKGREVASQYEFYATGSGATWWGSDASNSIKLTPDQTMYNPGDTAHILMESALPAGDYLITVEREGIYSEEVRHFDEPCNVIDVKIARNFVPVVYVAVSSYSVRKGEPTHEYGEVDVDKPKGYFGVTPVFVNARVRAFSVDVKTDKPVYRPGDLATVTLTATKGGKPVEGAEITAFAADRAVLDLINYHVPDPISFFYNPGNFPLRVKGGDSRDYLMDPVTYSIKNLQGGDSSNKDEDERKDFRPTAFFEPALITDANGQVTCTFTVPSNLTTFRLTAFGVKGELLALQESEFAVQNLINVQAVQTRRLRVRDTAECGVLVTNLDSTGHDVTVSMEIRGPSASYKENEEMGLGTIAGKAFIDGENTKTVHVASGSSSVVYFDVGAKEQGNVEFVYTVKSDVFSEKLVSKMIIEKTYVYETVATTSATDYFENKEETAEEKIIIPGFANDGLGNIKVTLDATHLGSLSSAVNYLFEYPYGCMEQQSSRVLPLIIFEDYIKVFGMESEVSSPRLCVKKFMREWKKIQRSDGGFPYWPDQDKESNLYVSMRIALICGLAKERGYSDFDLALDQDKLMEYIYDSVSDLTDTETRCYDDMRSYACYIFALNNDERLDSVLRDLTKTDVTDLQDRAYLGLAWSLKSGAEADMNAKKCANQVKSYLRPTTRSVDITSPASRYGWRYYYGGAATDLALITQLLVKINPEDQMVDRLIYRLLDEREGGYWRSTVTTANILEAMYTVIKERNLDATDFTALATISGKEIVKGSFKGAGAKPVTGTKFFLDELKDLPRDEELPLQIKANGTGTLYYTTTMTYALPDEVQNERDEGFKLSYTITDNSTGKVVNPSEGGMVVPLVSGKTYKITVQIESDKGHNYAALRVPVPSGCEILDSTFVTTGSEAETSSYYGYWSSRYIHDNEVQYFWNYMDHGRTVEFTFRASRRGVYPLTPVQVECMYEPEVFGRSNGYIFTIE